MNRIEFHRGPVTQRVRQSLRGDIISGGYVGYLPSMDQLAKTLGASRVTVRNVLKDLEEEGLLEIRQGIGSRVKDFSQEGVLKRPEIPGAFVDALSRYFDFLSNSDTPRELKVKTIQMVDAQIEFADEVNSLSK